MFENNFSQRFRRGASWLGARLKPVARELLNTDKVNGYLTDINRIKNVVMAGKRAYDQFKQGDDQWLDSAGAAAGQVGDAVGAAQSLYQRGAGDVEQARHILKKRRRKAIMPQN